MLVAALAAGFTQRLPELTQVLRSFHFTAPATPARPKAALQYHRVADSREQAFLTETPTG